MLPSLIAGELQTALTKYLGTTFALADEDVRERLETFLTSPEDGIFRGPYVRLRLPFEPAGEGWRSGVDWTPEGFQPYHHQAEAFTRLGSKSARPRPTLVTTGTGSGKTESFLIPIIDHCLRHRGSQGIKALILYPMNALANDQARRVDALLAQVDGVTAGLYTGDAEAVARGADGLVRQRRELRDNPPDILLTNYKMLDFLLLRPEDTALWAGAGQTLQYVVLDEFHTYDGAQGTDVAMLLRRLGMALGTVEPGRPLGRVTPVATSATLGDGTDGSRLLDFAGRVFGEPFGPDAVVGERRMGAAAWLEDTSDAPDSHDYDPLPLLEQVTDAIHRTDGGHLALLNAVAAVFFRDPNAEPVADPRDFTSDQHALGSRLRRHPLTRALLTAAATPRPLTDLVTAVAPGWANRTGAADAIAAFLALISHARSGIRPLVQVEVQLWVREVRRVDRLVATVAGFRWGLDSPKTTVADNYLPAVYCRHCGRSGWGTARRSRGQAMERDARSITTQSVSGSGRFRALLHAPGEVAANDLEPLSWLDPVSLDVHAKAPLGDHDFLPVLATPDDEKSRKDTCPSCHLDDGIRFLGSRVATLSSVALGHLFGSGDIERSEKKTLVFTDSVQDAAHRAGFIEARSYSLNFRSLLTRAVRGGSSLDEIGQALVTAAREPDDRFALLPPEMARDTGKFSAFWHGSRVPTSIRNVVKDRAAFGAVLEFGLNARTGRTLELTSTVTAHVDCAPEKMAAVAHTVIADYRERHPQLEFGAGADLRVPWVRGVLERMRLRGGIHHRWLNTYIHEDGNRWSIWGGRREHMPAFPSGRPAPAFPTTASRSDSFDSVVARGTWYCRWTARCLGVAESETPYLVRDLFAALARDGVVTATSTKSGVTVYYLEPQTVELVPTDPTDPGSVIRTLRCEVCSLRFPGAHGIADQLDGAPCLRDRCVGVLRPVPIGDDYYRRIYTSGRVRRVRAHEHTGMLDAATRVAVETAFKTSDSPDAPNVLTCTPTLELGIDIGDLSAVGLTSLPRTVAGYLQRVGRAGRQTGNALVFAVLPGIGIELHWLAEPLDMIAGDVVPPACHLDATEILRRQYLASLVDRAARESRDKPPRTAGRMLTVGLAQGSWLSELLRNARENAEQYTAEFLAGFSGHIGADTEAMVTAWAGVGLPADEICPLDRVVEKAVRAWQDEREELRLRVEALTAEATRLQDIEAVLDADGKKDLNRLRGELRAARGRMLGMARQYWITAFEALGLLPNYTLLDDRTTLDVGLTWTDERTNKTAVDRYTYERGSRVALAELAPGSTFYIDGGALRVDAVDLGTQHNPLVAPWRFCPTCGWSARDAGPVPCPRCGNNRAADTGQVLHAVPFRRVSAFTSRDSTRFGDEDDERKRARFVIQPVVDVADSDIERAWGLADYPFGAEFARSADIRWINLGRADTGGAERFIAGETLTAPLFEACRHCGVVPVAQGRDPVDARHRGWCPQRTKMGTGDWLHVALLHELRTQVVRLLVPPIVIADEIQLESTRAALLLGLRKVLGGEPDHLDVIVAPDPDQHRERYVLVLHDRVPGGTGYLARFAEPDRVRDLLASAHKALEECPCAEQGVQACHRCLLPYAKPSAVQLVRRDRALELFGEILKQWRPEAITSLREITASKHETPIELRFRALMHRWAKREKAEPRLTPGAGGDRLEFTLPDNRTWTMSAQPRLGFVQPDFLLSCTDPLAPDIAVFCDGHRFHATAEYNRLADDAEKRAGLRSDNKVVWTATHADLDDFERALDGTVTAQVPFTTKVQSTALAKLASRSTLFGPGQVSARDLAGDPITLLTRFLGRPDREAWSGPAAALAVALTGGNRADARLVDPAAVPRMLEAHLRGEHVDPPHGAALIVTRRTSGGAVALIDATRLDSPAVWLGVDDRSEHMTSPEAWRDWLAATNLLQFLGDRFAAGTTSLPAPHDMVPPPPRPDSVAPAWRPLLGVFPRSTSFSTIWQT
ncbi:DEAD/DEAH box helicase [Actinokineospora sp. G85]|uniref:DEAD/DEAH box helicase n=1 Tax=Actinokineospora sp. G85 TaxID=3406626 RepID=UPI003C72A671